MIIAGNKIYERCADCGKIVCLNKWLFGTLHLCITEAEKGLKRKMGVRPYPPVEPPKATGGMCANKQQRT